MAFRTMEVILTLVVAQPMLTDLKNMFQLHEVEISTHFKLPKCRSANLLTSLAALE